MIETDVCIIGSGPAGATTSMMLSKKKISHVLVDKSEFPRDKTCGDGLILYTFKVLKQIDPSLLNKFINDTRFISTKNAKFHFNDSTQIEINYDDKQDYEPIFYGKRFDFDAFLVENCTSPFVKQLYGSPVVSYEKTKDRILLKLKNGSIISTKMVVGADGYQSFVSRKIGENKIDHSRSSTFISAYFKGIEFLHNQNEAEVRIVRNKIPLFFYIFPLPNGEANVSIGGLSSDIQKYKIDLKKEINHLLSNHPKIKHRFINAEQSGNWRGWGIPCHFGHLNLFGDRYLLIGDAAGLANSFYKEGVGTGMMSGIIAAKKIEEAIKSNDFSESFLADYETSLSTEFGKLLKYSRAMMYLTKRKNMIDILVYFFKRKIEKKVLNVIQKRTY